MPSALPSPPHAETLTLSDNAESAQPLSLVLPMHLQCPHASLQTLQGLQDLSVRDYMIGKTDKHKLKMWYCTPTSMPREDKINFGLHLHRIPKVSGNSLHLQPRLDIAMSPSISSPDRMERSFDTYVGSATFPTIGSVVALM